MENNVFNASKYIGIKYFTNFKSLFSYLSSLDVKELENQSVLLDIEDELYLDFTNRIKILSNKTSLIAIGIPKEISLIKHLFKNGFNAYLDITNNEIDLIKAVEKASIKKYYLPEAKMEEIIQSIAQESNETNNIFSVVDKKATSLSLTKKDKEVVDFIIKGYTYKTISSILNISTFAVNQRTKQVYRKCGVKSRSELSYLLLK